MVKTLKSKNRYYSKKKRNKTLKKQRGGEIVSIKKVRKLVESVIRKHGSNQDFIKALFNMDSSSYSKIKSASGLTTDDKETLNIIQEGINMTGITYKNLMEGEFVEGQDFKKTWKKKYYEASLKYHPDLGGQVDVIQAAIIINREVQAEIKKAQELNPSTGDIEEIRKKLILDLDQNVINEQTVSTQELQELIKKLKGAQRPEQLVEYFKIKFKRLGNFYNDLLKKLYDYANKKTDDLQKSNFSSSSSSPEGLLYDDYPRSPEIETHFREQAAYTPLMYFSPMLAEFSEMKKFIKPNDAGNKFKLTSLKEFAKYVLSGPKNTTILPNIVKKMDDDTFLVFLFYYLVKLSALDKSPTLKLFNSEVDTNSVSLPKLLHEIMKLVCQVYQNTEHGASMRKSFGWQKQDNSQINFVQKRLVQMFCYLFHDFCINNLNSSYPEMQKLIHSLDLKLSVNTFQEIEKLFPGRFTQRTGSDIYTITKKDHDKSSNKILSQQILFHLCFNLISRKIEGITGSTALELGSSRVIEKINKKLSGGPQILEEKLKNAIDRRFIEIKIFREKEDSEIQSVENIQDMTNMLENFNLSSLGLESDFKFIDSYVMNLADIGMSRRSLDCNKVNNRFTRDDLFLPSGSQPLPRNQSPQGSRESPLGGKRSRKSTSKTRKPKSLKRPQRLSHRIKKAASVQSRKRVSKNRNTSHRRT